MVIINKKILYLVAEESYFYSHRFNLAKEAQKAGFEVAVATRFQETPFHENSKGNCKNDSGVDSSQSGLDSSHNHRQKIEATGIKVFPLRHFSRAGLNPWQQLLAIQELNRIYQEYRPDIVHHVALKPIILGSVVARFNKIPTVINALGGLGYLFTEPLGGFKKTMMRFFTCQILRRLFSKANAHLILQNPDDLAILLGAHVVLPHKVTLIRGSGVDINAFPETPPPPSTPSASLVISCVSRMLWDKGIGELVKAAEILKKYFKNKHNNDDDDDDGGGGGGGACNGGSDDDHNKDCNDNSKSILINLYGMPDPENPASIPTNQLEEWHRSGIINWQKYCDNVAKAYADCHIAVLPSYREGLPKSLLEAASCGRPIVTTDVPGCKEIVLQGQNGLLVPAQNAKALAEALIQLIENEKMRIQMGKRSREIAEEQFSDTIINQQIVQLYFSN